MIVDTIPIDGAQDFGAGFFRLCYDSLRAIRPIYAERIAQLFTGYDEPAKQDLLVPNGANSQTDRRCDL